jgi:hypothetical protein
MMNCNEKNNEMSQHHMYILLQIFLFYKQDRKPSMRYENVKCISATLFFEYIWVTRNLISIVVSVFYCVSKLYDKIQILSRVFPLS